MHVRGHAWQGGIHGKGGMCARGVCVARGMHSRGDMHGRGALWQGACVVGVMHGRGCVYGRGYAWLGGVHGTCIARERATAADSMHPTGMHSCLLLLFLLGIYQGFITRRVM